MNILHALDVLHIGGIQEMVLNLHKYDRVNSHHWWAADGSMSPILREEGMVIWTGGPPLELQESRYYDMVVGHGVGGWSYDDTANWAHERGAQFIEVMHSNARSLTTPMRVDGFVGLNRIATELNQHMPLARTIYGIVRPELFEIDGHGEIIGRLSRLVAEKNPMSFLQLAGRFPGERFVLGGDGAQLDLCFAAKPPNVEMTGMVRGFVSFFRELKLFVFPTFDECCCMVVAIAQAAGVPVICSNIAPLRETTGGFASFAADDYGFESLVRAYLNFPGPFREKAAEGREWARRSFHPDVVCEQWNELFEEVMG